MNGEKVRQIMRVTGVPPVTIRRIVEMAGTTPSTLDYSDLKKATLRDLLDNLGIDYPSKATKGELVQLLEDA